MEKKTKDDIRMEALEAICKWKHSGACISMGVGKTRLGLEHFQKVINAIHKQELRLATALVVAPTKKILKGWEEEAILWNMSHLLEFISFTTYRSLNTLDLTQYDVIYLDECHSLIRESHDKCLSDFKGYIIGLTGTLPHSSSDKYKLIEKHCPIYYTYLIDEAIDDKIINDYRIKVHLLNLNTNKTHKIEIKDKSGNIIKSWYTSEKENYDYWTNKLNNALSPKERQMCSIFRMKALQTFKTKDVYAKKLLNSIDEKCILFANERKQADNLCSHSYHSDNKDSESNMEKFESGIIKKLSCVLQLGIGANIKGLKEMIIMHSYGNNSKLAQRLGRACRLSVDETGIIHVLCFENTVDQQWVSDALSQFDQSKIEWIKIN